MGFETLPECRPKSLLRSSGRNRGNNNDEGSCQVTYRASLRRVSRCHRNKARSHGLIIGAIPQYVRVICVKRMHRHNAATNGDLVVVPRVSYRNAQRCENIYVRVRECEHSASSPIRTIRSAIPEQKGKHLLGSKRNY